MNDLIKKQRNIQRELSMVNSFKELSTLIEKNLSFFVEHQISLTLKIQDPIIMRNSYGDDIAIINLFSSIEKINPFSSELIRLLLQLKNTDNVKKLVNEKKNTIIPILNEIYLEPYSLDDFAEDGDIHGKQECIIYKNYCFNPQTAETLIEELIPYLSPSSCLVFDNLYWLNQTPDPLQKITERKIREKKIPLNLLLQVIKTSNKKEEQPLMSLLNNILQLEIEIFGTENIFDIEQGIHGLFYLQVDPKIRQKVKEKIIDAILNQKEEEKEQFPFRDSLKTTIQYINYLSQVQGEIEKGIALEESNLYQKCLNLFLPSQIEKKDQYSDYKKLFKIWIVDTTKEPTTKERKRKLLLEFPEILKVKTEKEMITFLRIKKQIENANNYKIEKLISYHAEDFYTLLELIELEKNKGMNKKNFDFFRITDPSHFTFDLLLTLGKRTSLYLINHVPLPELKYIIKKIKTEEIPISFLENILKLSEMYQRKIPYNKTELYQQTYNQYRARIKEKQQEITDHYDKYIEFIFNKIIRTENFIKCLLEIDTIKKIIFFYKTETAYFQEENFSINEIETMNPRQWRKIKNRIEAKTPIRSTAAEIEINTNALKLAVILGYEIASLLLDQPSSYKALADFTVGLETKKQQKEILTGFRICIKEHPNIFELPSELLKEYYHWYTDLSRNLRKKITYEDILKYESISKENFLKQENYYAISNHIQWIEPKNYKRNLFKTGKLWLEQKKRKISTIPDYQGTIEEYRYEFVDLHDPNLIFLPNKINCCMTIGNKAESDLIHAAVNENGRLFAVYKGDKVIAISWVWRNNQILCFDNIEVERNEINKTTSEILLQILKDTSNAILRISENNEPEEEKIKVITLGRNPHDVKLNLEDNIELSQYQNEMYHPKNHTELYIKDSEKQQYIIGGSYIKTIGKEPTTRYTYSRKKPIKFEEIDKLSLELMIKSIKKDYNINSNTPIYTIGYIGEDFYIGITANGKIDIVYPKDDKEVEQEVKQLLEKLKQEQIERAKQEEISKQQIEKIQKKEYEIKDQNELISLIEKSLPYQLDPSDYYHGSLKIIEILETGEIKCPYLLKIRNNNYNGDFHICVAKNLNYNNEAFNSYIKNKTSIILKKELPVIDKDSTEFNFLNPFFIEGRKKTYGYKDEFQIRETIPSEYFKAIYAPTNNLKQLITIRRLIDALEIFQLELPVVSNTSNTIIDKELVKKYITPKIEDSN